VFVSDLLSPGGGSIVLVQIYYSSSYIVGMKFVWKLSTLMTDGERGTDLGLDAMYYCIILGIYYL